MNPLYFGAADSPLFGVYHPPRTRSTRAHGVVLCYPLGQEYMRAHRAFRQLAILLSRAGLPVMRFDYAGTGDSGGDVEIGSFERWTRDITFAIDELKENSGAEQVSLIGLRLGACLAARAQAQRADVVRVVLWDPVVDGPSYWKELLGSTETRTDDGNATADVVGIYGFAWTRTLRESVAAMTPGSYPLADRTRISMFVSSERSDYESLRNRYNGLNGRFTYRHVPGPGDWAFIDAYGSALLPQDIIQAIVAHVTQESAS